MENRIDPIDHEADPEALQEQIRSDPIEIDLREEQDHLLLAIVTTLVPETVLLDVDLHSDAHLLETTGEQDPHLEPEVHQEDSLLGEMTIGGSGLGRRGMIGMSLRIRSVKNAANTSQEKIQITI